MEEREIRNFSAVIAGNGIPSLRSEQAPQSHTNKKKKRVNRK